MPKWNFCQATMVPYGSPLNIMFALKYGESPKANTDVATINIDFTILFTNNWILKTDEQVCKS